jgi:hypothetical protein
MVRVNTRHTENAENEAPKVPANQRLRSSSSVSAFSSSSATSVQSKASDSEVSARRPLARHLQPSASTTSLQSAKSQDDNTFGKKPITKRLVSSSSTTSLESKSSDKVNKKVSKKNESKLQEDDEKEEEEEAEMEEESEKEASESDLQFSKLQLKLSASKKSVCHKCEEDNDDERPLIDCLGSCKRSFHAECAESSDKTAAGASFKCSQCVSDLHPDCFECKKAATKQEPTIQCSHKSCFRFYHAACTNSNDKFRHDTKGGASSSFTCPLHTCLSCWSDVKINAGESSSTLDSAVKGRFVQCIRCPTAYHASEHCLAAGSLVLNNTYIVCPDHGHQSKGKSSSGTNLSNVRWCFLCCKSGQLITCKRCPAAYHKKCLKNLADASVNMDGVEEELNETGDAASSESEQEDKPSPKPTDGESTTTTTKKKTKAKKAPSNWLCEDCSLGKRPLYGQIVWCKFGKRMNF